MKLSVQETNLRTLLMRGFSNKEIADKLQITEKTVKFHCTRLYKKATVTSRSQFMAKEYLKVVPQELDIQIVKVRPTVAVKQPESPVEYNKLSSGVFNVRI